MDNTATAIPANRRLVRRFTDFSRTDTSSGLSFALLAAGAGLALRATWSDDAELFAVHYLAPEGSAQPD